MGMMDNIKNQAQQAMENNPDKVEELSDQAIQKAGDTADGATGGKFSEQIDGAEQQADGRIGE